VLNKLPHASLDELRVERPGSAAEQLESRVHFTLFYRERTSGANAPHGSSRLC